MLILDAGSLVRAFGECGRVTDYAACAGKASHVAYLLVLVRT